MVHMDCGFWHMGTATDDNSNVRCVFTKLFQVESMTEPTQGWRKELKNVSTINYDSHIEDFIAHTLAKELEQAAVAVEKSLGTFRDDKYTFRLGVEDAAAIIRSRIVL